MIGPNHKRIIRSELTDKVKTKKIRLEKKRELFLVFLNIEKTRNRRMEKEEKEEEEEEERKRI